MDKNRRFNWVGKISQSIILTIVIMIILFMRDEKGVFTKVLLYETLPFLNIRKDMQMLFKFNAKEYPEIENKTIETFVNTDSEEDILEVSNNYSDDIIGTYNVIFQDDTKIATLSDITKEEILTINDIEKLKDIDYLRSKFYIQESTLVTEEDFNVDRFLNTNLKINNSVHEPKILIFHTHINEMYADSNENILTDGIYGVGAELKKVLEQTYNIDVIHVDYEYDKVDGKRQILGAYERMESDILKILVENPSIEIVIDMHRDGIDESKKLVTEINGKPTAQVMFLNGMSKILKNNELQKLESLPNPNLAENLAFSFNMQLTANAIYPNFTRKVYLKPYRFSLHMKGKSLLIEVGAQTNTMEEAKNTAKPLADILAKVILD